MSDEEFYEQFHRKGGDYLMPDKVFEDLLYEKEELEKENKKLKQWDNNKDSRNSRQRIANKKLIQENAKLKKKLEKLQKPQIFIDTQDIEERYAEGKYQDYLEEQVKELKKQLEEYKNSHYCSFIETCKNVKIANYEQQQEFIKYLEQCIENEKYCYLAEKQEDRVRKDIFEEILQKYKEIIGVSHD